MDFLIDEQADSGSPAKSSEDNTWRILIVDDAEDVHDATRFALRGFSFEGANIQLLHALTAEEARSILQNEDNIAVAIVDVVMESEQAGIQLVDWMRNTLGNRTTRVILRTGQPGYAPESDVILKHEIDGYKEKSEMTRTRLVTMLVTALRGFKQIRALQEHEASLRKLVDGLGDLLNTREVERFANSLISQLAALFNGEPSGMVCIAETSGDSSQGIDPRNVTKEQLRIITGVGAYKDVEGNRICDIASDKLRETVEQCMQSKQPVVADGMAGVFLHTSSGLCGVVLLDLADHVTAPNEAVELLRLFSINAAVGYENARLFENVHRLAYTETNTGMPNFTAFAETFRLHCEAHPDTPAAVVLFDVQRYRVIEHGIGPEHALKALKAAGQRLREGLPDAPIVAHRRGDEFALMITGRQIYEPDKLTARIEALFETPLRVGDVVFTLRPRLSLAERQCDEDDAHVLARRASVALDELRRSGAGAGRYIVYDEAMSKAAYERLHIATMLSGEHATDICHVYCQPIIDSQTETVVSGEALLRFIQPDGTMLNTGHAIAAAEASGLILNLGRWALERGMQQHRALMDMGETTRLNINLSPAQIQSNQITRHFAEAFETTGFPPDRLNVEVTEGLFMEGDAQTISVLQWLRDQGARILIDDFGTGYSSLSYLRKLPVDGLKIDRSFVMDMVDNADCHAIVGSIVGVGKALGLELTAEGVETIAERDALREMGVEKLQGFLYARGLPHEEFINYTRRQGRG